MLKDLDCQKRFAAAHLTTPVAAANEYSSVIRQQENELLDLIEKRKHSSTLSWPLKKFRVATFANDEGLKRLRLFKTQRIHHEAAIITEVSGLRTSPTSNNNKKTCALCTIRRTTRMCSWCEVPLCTSNRRRSDPGGEKLTCFQRWHSVTDLVTESEAAKADISDT